MRFIEWLSKWTIVDKDYLEGLEQCKNQLLETAEDNAEYLDQIRSLSFKLENRENKIKALKAQYEPHPLEDYWNKKRAKVCRGHPARDGVEVDVRVFWQKDYKLPTFRGTNDEIAEQALSWCIMNLQYTSDNKGEFWQYAYETLLTRTGDCEDGAILMANMMVMSGVPYWRVRLNAGNVQGGGHAYVTYLREEDNEWYVLDWCYWPHESIGFGKTWKDAKKYFKIWYSWNKEYTFSDLPKNS